ncbi:hypothetical protein [Paenibacillus sp. GM2]|uniref:hypothetical protein n=1 Tax=Paenibacillus sp. GM2 TaxID=1622070 RepID=UPI000839C5CA|nr:hypothetical protein [Paenibacillus sp. GM2]
MAKTDWNLRDTVRPEEMNELGQEVNEHGGKIAEQELEISEHDRTLLKQGAKITEQGESISALENRLDTEEYSEITLQPGLQVVKAERDARFRLGSIKGRTLINLLGSAGGCEDNLSWSTPNGTISVDTSLKDSGSASLKYKHNNISVPSAYVRSIYFNIDPSKHLIILAWIKSNNKYMGTRLVTASGGNIPTSLNKGIEPNMSGVVFRAFTPTELGSNTSVCVDVYSNDTFANGDSFNFDSVRVYNIIPENYESLSATLNSERLNSNFPYVSSGIIGVENPYIMRYGENLLPPFYEWSTGSGVSFLNINSAYDVTATFTTTSAGNGFRVSVPALARQSYVIHWGLNSREVIWVGYYDAIGNQITAINAAHGIEFITPEGTTTISLSWYAPNGGTISLKNPMLTLGNEPKLFRTREDSMLAFQTELIAYPMSGNEPDELFERNGQYFKLEKWKKVVLNEELNWKYDSATTAKPGLKRVYATLPSLGFSFSGFATKYNGMPLVNSGEFNAPDQFVIWEQQFVYLSLSVADCGWGPDYTPTVEEVKAYFNGWKMFNWDGSTGGDNNGVSTYNGESGQLKAWIQISEVGTSGISRTTILPRNQAPITSKWSPYNLIYRLAKEFVKSVVTEGCLALNGGDNIVEVGTGIILREPVYPAYYSDGGVGYYWLNNHAVDSVVGGNSSFKYLCNDIKYIYKGNKNEKSKWTTIKNHSSASSNGEIAFIQAADYDQFGTYSVTYLKLDKSSISQINGTVGRNEKAQLSDLNQGVAEALHGVSVLTMKKEEKDKVQPVVNWIYPTLLNGWTLSSKGVFPAQYYKDENGIVHINGIVNSGTNGSIIFTLPSGYRPKTTHRISAVINSGANFNISFFDITSNGNVTATFPGNVMHLPLHCSFIAEQ